MVDTFTVPKMEHLTQSPTPQKLRGDESADHKGDNDCEKKVPFLISHESVSFARTSPNGWPDFTLKSGFVQHSGASQEDKFIGIAVQI